MNVPVRVDEIRRIVAMLFVPTDAIMLTRQAWEQLAVSIPHKVRHQQRPGVCQLCQFSMECATVVTPLQGRVSIEGARNPNDRLLNHTHAVTLEQSKVVTTSRETNKGREFSVYLLTHLLLCLMC